LARAEGEFAASQGDLEAAMNHLSRSEEIFRTYSLPWELAGTLESWAKAAYAKGDQQIANDKKAAALAIYRSREAGQPWIDSRAATRDHVCGARGSGPPRNIFRKQGEYWAISFGDAEFNLKDSKGLHYIAHLLRNSGQQVSSVDLAALTNPHAPEIAIRAPLSMSQVPIPARIWATLEKFSTRTPRCNTNTGSRTCEKRSNAGSARTIPAQWKKPAPSSTRY